MINWRLNFIICFNLLLWSYFGLMTSHGFDELNTVFFFNEVISISLHNLCFFSLISSFNIDMIRN